MKLSAALAFNLAVLAVAAPASVSKRQNGNPVNDLMGMLHLGQADTSSTASGPKPTPTMTPNSNMNFPGEQNAEIQQHGAASSAALMPTPSSSLHASAASSSAVKAPEVTGSATPTPSPSASAKPESDDSILSNLPLVNSLSSLLGGSR